MITRSNLLTAVTGNSICSSDFTYISCEGGDYLVRTWTDTICVFIYIFLYFYFVILLLLFFFHSKSNSKSNSKFNSKSNSNSNSNQLEDLRLPHILGSWNLTKGKLYHMRLRKLQHDPTSDWPMYWQTATALPGRRDGAPYKKEIYEALLLVTGTTGAWALGDREARERARRKNNKNKRTPRCNFFRRACHRASRTPNA